MACAKILEIALPTAQSLFYYNLLSDKNPNVRKKAAETLGKLGDKTCLPRLKEVLYKTKKVNVIERRGKPYCHRGYDFIFLFGFI